MRAAYHSAVLRWPYHAEALIIGDGRVYHDAARRILHGNPWGVPVSYQDPLYPALLALMVRLTASDLAGPLIVQHTLGLASAALAWVIARRMAGPLAGLVAAAFAALSPVAIYYEGLIEKSTPGIFIFALAVWFLASGLGQGRAGRIAGAGAALALVSLLRGNALLVLPVASLAILLTYPRALPAGRGILALVIGVAVVFIPAMARNRMISGSWALTAGQGGANFWVGNNPGNATGTFRPPPFLRADPALEEIDWRVEAERRTSGSLSRDEVSRFWFREGLRFWKDQPWAALWNTLRKARWYFSAYELPDTQAYPFFRDHFRILRLPLPGMGPIVALALAGMLFSLAAWRARSAEFWLFVGYATSVILFFVLGRYRVVALSLFAAFAGVAIATLADWVRRREMRKLAGAAAVLVIAFGVAYRARPRERYVFPRLNIALALWQEGRLEEAERFTREGLVINPRDVPSLELLGEIALERGDLSEANRALMKAIFIDPTRQSLQFAVIRLLERQGRKQQAVDLLRLMLRKDPFNETVRKELRALGSGP